MAFFVFSRKNRFTLYRYPARPQLRQRRAVTHGQQPSFDVNAQLVAGVHDVQIAHGQLADAVSGGERGVFDFFHAQALWLVGQVGAFGVEERVIVATAQLDGHFASDGACNPALGGFAQHDALRVKPAALVQQAAEFQAVHAVLLNRVFVVNAGDQALVGDVQAAPNLGLRRCHGFSLR